MLEQFVENLVHTKQIFAKTYDGNAHIQEVIPTKVSEEFDMDSEYLENLHNFALKNPIYFNHY